MNQGESVAEDWNTVSYDDSAWTTMKAAAIPDATSTTIYIRKSFQLTNVNEYSVMNIRLKYTGGVVVYFNGNRVARFNLVENFDASTESIALHDAETFSKFHIILSMAGVQEGTNVIAFELHRPVGVSSPYIVVFDATGVFGMNDCSTVIDSYSEVKSAYGYSCAEALLSMDPYESCWFGGKRESYVEWTVENLEGSKWNAFNLFTASTRKWGFDLEYNLSYNTSIKSENNHRTPNGRV